MVNPPSTLIQASAFSGARTRSLQNQIYYSRLVGAKYIKITQRIVFIYNIIITGGPIRQTS